jgi:elongin-A
MPRLLPLVVERPTDYAPDLNDVGDFEYWKIRPVLLRLDSPAQLHQIETNSPQICGEDAELWRNFIIRDFPNWELKKYVPKNPLKWYRVYIKYKKEQELEIARDEEVLRASMGQLQKAKETNVSKVVDLRSLPKVPRDPWMLANNGGVPIGRKSGMFKKEGPGSLSWAGGSKTKMTNGQSVLTRARREAKEISQRSKLAKPTHELKGQAGQVRKAPAGMVNEYRRAAEAPIRILSRKKPAAKSSNAASGPSLEEREGRLSAIQSGLNQKSSASANETLIGSSDEDDLETLFDEKPAQRPRPSPSSSIHLSASSPHPSTASKSVAQPSTSPGPISQQPKRPLSSSGGTLPSSKTSPGASSVKPIPRVAGSAPESTSSAPSGFSLSPAKGERKPAPGIVRKRVEVDIFNRGASKKPRIR